MANVEHNSLTGSALHENKGVAAASDNTVATAVSGATVWAKLTASNLQTSGNPLGGQLFHIRDQVSSGTASQGTLTASTWNVRRFQTEVTDEITASIASNQISLPSGTYVVQGWANLYMSIGLGFNQSGTVKGTLRLRNVTDSTTLVTGMGVLLSDTTTSNETSDVDTMSIQTINGRFTVGSAKLIELQNWISTSGGVSATAGTAISSGENETYAELMFYKIA